MLFEYIFLAIVGLFMAIMPKLTYKMVELPTSDLTGKPINSYVWGIRICGLIFAVTGIYFIILYIKGQPMIISWR